jgi:hypothetical protein
MGEDKRENIFYVFRFQAGHAGSIPVTRSKLLRVKCIQFSLTRYKHRRF